MNLPQKIKDCNPFYRGFLHITTKLGFPFYIFSYSIGQTDYSIHWSYRVCLTRLQLDEYFVNFIQILKYNDIKNTCIRGGSDDESALIYNDWADQYL